MKNHRQFRSRFFATMAVLLVISFFPRGWCEEKKSTLDAVEREASGPSSEKSDSSVSSSSRSSDRASDAFIETLAEIFLMGMIAQAQMEGGFGQLHQNLKSEHSFVLPTFHVEPSYQYVSGHINAFEGRVEAGYLMFGVDGDFTHYIETEPASNLNVYSAHVLLRTMFSRYFGMNLAIGAKGLYQSHSHTGVEIGIPIYVPIVRDMFQIDVHPYWSRINNASVFDIDTGVSFKYKFAGIRAGYRMLKVGGTKLQGPKVGIFFHW